MQIWTSIFANQHDPDNHTPLKPIMARALNAVTMWADLESEISETTTQFAIPQL